MKNERVLAEIAKIDFLTPIKGADRIEVAAIRGWEIVVQKDLYKVGDLVVYFSIDSVLPEIPEFEFLRKNCYVSEKSSVNGAGFRLKTIKLKKQISQGLVIPIREVYNYLYDGDHTDLSEGVDVTSYLHVVKYERPVPAALAGQVRGNFPSFIPKTDQERIQNFFGRFWREYRDHEWEVSLKLDGSSMTAYYYAPEDRFGVCSRNMDLTETEGNAFWQVARKNNLEEHLRTLSCGIIQVDNISSFAFQGELMGPGVQGNRENLAELDFYVYDIWDIDNQTYVDSRTRIEICNHFGLKHVPIYETAKFGFDDAKGFLQLAEFDYGNGMSINHPEREGLVFKSIQDPSISFKAISNKFLMGED